MTPQPDVLDQIAGLRRQMRWLAGGLLGLAAVGLIAAAPMAAGVIRVKGLIIVDDQGRERVLLGAPAPKVAGRREDVTPSLIFRGENGADRLIVGEAPSPIIGGKTFPRIAAAWGMTLFNPNGDERGGMAYLDNGRSVVALDRANAEGVYLTVNEQSGFAGLVTNYASEGTGQYAEAVRLGTKGRIAYLQAMNVDGSPAGALVTGERGNAKLKDKVE